MLKYQSLLIPIFFALVAVAQSANGVAMFDILERCQTIWYLVE